MSPGALRVGGGSFGGGYDDSGSAIDKECALTPMFIYPGSIRRTKVKIVAELQSRMTPKTTCIREVCAGSALASLELARSHPALAVHLNDLDPYMYAFWQAVAEGTPADDKRLTRLLQQQPTLARFDRLRREQASLSSLSRVDRAYHAVFFHRCTYSGIFSGAVKGGREQTSCKLDIYYQPEALVRAYAELVQLLRGRTLVTNLDVCDCIRRFSGRPDDIWFIDPPWIERGSGWYLCSMDLEAHRRLAAFLTQDRLPKGRWLMVIGQHASLARLYHNCRLRLVKVWRTAGRAQTSQTDVLIDRPVTGAAVAKRPPCTARSASRKRLRSA